MASRIRQLSFGPVRNLLDFLRAPIACWVGRKLAVPQADSSRRRLAKSTDLFIYSTLASVGPTVLLVVAACSSPEATRPDAASGKDATAVLDSAGVDTASGASDASTGSPDAGNDASNDANGETAEDITTAVGPDAGPPPDGFGIQFATAAADFTLTTADREAFQAKVKSGEDFNKMFVRPEVAVASAAQANAAVVSANTIVLPLAGNESLLKLKSGTPYVGDRANAGQRNPGNAKNPLGFLRIVKSVAQEGATVVIQTEPANLNEVLVGAMQVTFPKYMAQIDLGPDFKVETVLKDLPPAIDTRIESRQSEFVAQAKRDLDAAYLLSMQAWDAKLTFGFSIGQKLKLLELMEDLSFASGALNVSGTGWIEPYASVEFWAKMALEAGVTGIDYFYGGFGGEIAAGVKADVDVEVKVTGTAGAGSDKGKENNAADTLKNLAKKPVKKKGDKFRIGSPITFAGPPIGPIPTTFVLTVQAECAFAVKGKMKLAGEAGAKFSSEIGVEYDGDNWKPKVGLGADTVWSWTVEPSKIGVEIRCEAGPRLSWLLADFAGPFVENRLGARAEASIEKYCEDPDWVQMESAGLGLFKAGLTAYLNPALGATIDFKLFDISYSKQLCDPDKPSDIGFIKEICDALTWKLWSGEWKINTGWGTCPGHCENGVQDSEELGVDCGGQSWASLGQKCPAICPPGTKCIKHAQCGDNSMCIDGTCKPSTCSNGKKDAPLELDVDCGNDCKTLFGKLCKNGQACTHASDCDSNLCQGGKCKGIDCTNSIQDNLETDVDCGAAFCPKCKNGFTCAWGGDCLTGSCQAVPTSSGGSMQICALAECNLDALFKGEVAAGGACGAGNFYKFDNKICRTIDGKKLCGKQALLIGLDGACKANGDCASGWCENGSVCAKLKCDDGKQNGPEVDVDCGGPCPKCKVDQKCNSSDDCADNNGCAELFGVKRCQPCAKDGKKNGWETDVDCGGKCIESKFAEGKLCELFQTCVINADCMQSYNYFGPADPKTGSQPLTKVTSAVCDGSKCVSTCHNGKQDFGEPDQDCGAPCAQKCKEGKKCNKWFDCESGNCLAGLCIGPCSNGKKDAEEGGVDCGGPKCEFKCLKGMTCNVDSDCSTNQCIKGVCGVDLCIDKKQSGAEGDVDCGGVCAKKCDIGQGCKSALDCANNGVCSAGGKCVATACEDQIKSKGEAGIDCGGTCSVKCKVGDTCKVAGDCASGVCAQTGLCVATTCEDGLMTKAKGETDVDCAGSCSKCTAGKGCAKGSDCDSGICNGAICVGGACEDKQPSAGEADTDCGGNCQKQCLTSMGCNVGADCVSGVCSLGHLCVLNTCEDGKKTGDESDVDCGGSCPTKCLELAGCATPTDCVSGWCHANKKTCVASSCEDGVKNNGEPQVDCGGGGCVGCPDGATCTEDNQCATGGCSGEPGKKTCGCPTWSVPTQVTTGGKKKAVCACDAPCFEKLWVTKLPQLQAKGVPANEMLPHKAGDEVAAGSGTQFFRDNVAGLDVAGVTTLGGGKNGNFGAYQFVAGKGVDTNAILSQAVAAEYCDKITAGGFDDWRLPMPYEVKYLRDRYPVGTHAWSVTFGKLGYTGAQFQGTTRFSTPKYDWSAGLGPGAMGFAFPGYYDCSGPRPVSIGSFATATPAGTPGFNAKFGSATVYFAPYTSCFWANAIEKDVGNTFLGACRGLLDGQTCDALAGFSNVYQVASLDFIQESDSGILGTMKTSTVICVRGGDLSAVSGERYSLSSGKGEVMLDMLGGKHYQRVPALIQSAFQAGPYCGALQFVDSTLPAKPESPAYHKLFLPKDYHPGFMQFNANGPAWDQENFGLIMNVTEIVGLVSPNCGKDGNGGHVQALLQNGDGLFMTKQNIGYCYGTTPYTSYQNALELNKKQKFAVRCTANASPAIWSKP